MTPNLAYFSNNGSLKS